LYAELLFYSKLLRKITVGGEKPARPWRQFKKKTLNICFWPFALNGANVKKCLKLSNFIFCTKLRRKITAEEEKNQYWNVHSTVHGHCSS
jgi:hypothetical protein